MFAVPRNEYVIVLVYTMSRNYREDVAFLWDGRVVFAFDIDSAYQFDTDPRGFNTETNVSS